jgi:hypothetical protein
MGHLLSFKHLFWVGVAKALAFSVYTRGNFHQNGFQVLFDRDSCFAVKESSIAFQARLSTFAGFILSSFPLCQAG